MTRFLFLAIATTLTGPAAAELCRYEDANGAVTYSNTPVKGARRISCLPAVPTPPDGSSRPQSQQADQVPPAARAPSPAEARREELRAQLAAEQERLRIAREQLAQQEAIRTGDERNYQRVLDRLKPYQEAVRQAEQAVQELEAELAGAR